MPEIDVGSLLSIYMKSLSDFPSASSSVFLCILLFTFRLKTGLEIGVDPTDLLPRDAELKRSDFLWSFLSFFFMVIMDAEYRSERREPGSDISNQTNCEPETS